MFPAYFIRGVECRRVVTIKKSSQSEVQVEDCCQISPLSNFLLFKWRVGISSISSPKVSYFFSLQPPLNLGVGSWWDIRGQPEGAYFKARVWWRLALCHLHTSLLGLSHWHPEVGSTCFFFFYFPWWTTLSWPPSTTRYTNSRCVSNDHLFQVNNANIHVMYIITFVFIVKVINYIFCFYINEFLHEICILSNHRNLCMS